MLFAGVSFLIATTLASVASAAGTGINTNLVQQLKVATTNMDRMNLLPESSDWFFDFTKSDKYTFSPGGVIYADAATFPATIGNGMSMVSRPFLHMAYSNIRSPSSTLVLALCFHPTFTHEQQSTLLPSKAQPTPG